MLLGGDEVVVYYRHMFSETQIIPLSFLGQEASRAEAAAWNEASEGELSVDVLETAGELVIVATMAGTRPEDIELHLHNDVLTIRGRRISPGESGADYYYQECYWGAFSRTIVLPVEVRPEPARAEYRAGVLTLRLAKIKNSAAIPILVVEE